MGLTMKEKQAVTKEIAGRYRKGGKKEKGKILNEFCEITGYARKYAITVLRNWGKESWVWIDGKLVKVVGIRKQKKEGRRKRPRKYDGVVLKVLKQIWYLFDCMCGKRLVVVIRNNLTLLEKYGEVDIDKEVREKLMSISAATVDRVFRKERQKLRVKGRSHTRPGSILKQQIPIRTFSEWDDAKVGFVEVDLVGHEGGDSRGDYAYTLNVTDVCCGWTEPYAVKNRAQKWVFEGLMDVTKRLPFPLLGIDSDNGSEFINAHLIRYCNKHQITFTRSRPYRKNDNCFVEQKNYTVVRHLVWYMRYDTEEEVATLNEIYRSGRLLMNFFYPSMKLKEKERRGSKVRKRYDAPKSPYERILAREDVEEENKEQLREQRERLNPVELQRKIRRLQEKLLRLAEVKNREQIEAE